MPSSRKEKGSGVTSQNPWAIYSSRSVEQPQGRAAFIAWNNVEDENKYFSCTAQSDLMKFIIHTEKFAITRLQYFCQPKDLDF